MVKLQKRKITEVLAISRCTADGQFIGWPGIAGGALTPPVSCQICFAARQTLSIRFLKRVHRAESMSGWIDTVSPVRAERAAASAQASAAMPSSRVTGITESPLTAWTKAPHSAS